MTVVILFYGCRGLQKFVSVGATTESGSAAYVLISPQWLKTFYSGGGKKKFAAVSKPPMISGKVKITGTVTVPGTPIIKIIVIATIVSSDDDDRQWDTETGIVAPPIIAIGTAKNDRNRDYNLQCIRH